ncbi:hypothetical protein ACJRO7_007459 [Eucalyptus globulus]|uniref:RNase H type-1 domain-containing protein n=1 Tax=Eucalyptus globulus TaxID=34317 RepID=A0ABD3IL93_EUCGL
MAGGNTKRTCLSPEELWRPPNPGFLKVNINGAFQPGGSEGTMACICRDHNGKFIDGLTISFVASSALQAEFQALKITLRYLLEKNKGIDLLVLESYSKTLIDSVIGLLDSPWEVRSLCAEAVALLRDFCNLQIRFCRRGANFGADWAAKAHKIGTLPLS